MPSVENLTRVERILPGLIGGGIALLLAIAFVAKATSERGTFTNERSEEDRRKKENMKKTAEFIRNGAKTFLKIEYKYLFVFCAAMVLALGLLLRTDENEVAGVYTFVCFIVGAGFSALAGYCGMLTATSSNWRTAQACDRGTLSDGLRVAFSSGAVMSNTVVGLGLLGLSVLYVIFAEVEADRDGGRQDRVWNYLSGFGFGASSIALFARVGGGVFTKAADVGADLVGKVEAGLEEDDPRNAACIADNVGDNVGDVAGMGADLFESYVGSIIATATLAADFGFDPAVADAAIALPFWIAGFGVVASLIGTMVIMCKPLDSKADLGTLLWLIRAGIIVAGIFVIGFSALCCFLLFEADNGARLFGCVIIGLVAGILIGQFTEYCTSYEEAPTRGISDAAQRGAASVVIRGLGVGMISVVVPSLLIAITVLGCNFLVKNMTLVGGLEPISGLYGVSLAAVGMLSTLGVTLATDAYGPVADNAGGLAEMANLDPEVREKTDKLDSLGNTTAATGKGFAIGSAVLTALGLISAFMKESGLGSASVSLADPVLLMGVLIGAMMPFLFAALTMLSVEKSANAVIVEVRRQVQLCPALVKKDVKDRTAKFEGLDGEQYPQHERCVTLCTSSAVEEMVLPGLISVFSPVIIGYLMGVVGLTGFLIGALAAGFMLALTMANAGGAWDNAKKYVEKIGKSKGSGDAKFLAERAKYGRKLDLVSEVNNAEDLKLYEAYLNTHSAAVQGDTVGDPFKDTSGPALNILIKLMSIVSLVIGPALSRLGEPEGFGEDGWIVALVTTAIVAFLIIVLLCIFKVCFCSYGFSCIC